MAEWPGTPVAPQQQWPGTPVAPQPQAAQQWPGTPVEQPTQRHSPEDIARTREQAMSRITNIPSDIAGVFKEGVHSLSQVPGEAWNPTPREGVVGRGLDVATRLGIPVAHPAVTNLMAGFFDIVGAPVKGALRSTVTRPLEEETGVPKEVYELPIDLVAPGGTVKALGLAGKTIKSVAASPFGKLVEKALSPTTVDSDAGFAEAIIRQQYGTAARETAQTEHALESFHKHVNAMDDAARLDLIGYIEGRSMRAPLADPNLQAGADAMRAAFKRREDRLRSMPATAQASFIEDFFPHFWQDPKAGRAVAASWAVGKQGSGASLHKRIIPTIEDGINAGLVPVSTNPIEMAMRYVTSMDKFIASTEVLEAAKTAGSIKYIRPKIMGASGHPDPLKGVPDGWVPLKGRGAKSPTGETAYAPEGFARVYNNFISKGFHEWDTAGTIYSNLQRSSNAITALELGLSGFHAVTMANEAGISALARGVDAIVGGARAGDWRTMLRGAKEVGKSPVKFITSAMTGKKLEQVYLGRTQGTAEMREITDLLEKAGGRAVGFRHAADYEFSPMNSYWTSFRRGALKAEMQADLAALKASTTAGQAAWQGLRVGFRNMGRIMQTVAQPLFEKYIPRLKNGAFYDTMHEWMLQHPMATREEKITQARVIWDSIDNRFGEMVQDNIFWNKMLKQTAQLGMRSYSWNLGTGREIGGGAKDLASKTWSPRAAYAIALPIWFGSMNAAYQYLRTGKSPESVQDLLAGQTGGTAPGASVPSAKPFGRSTRDTVKERVSIPGYQKDVMGWYEDWFQEAKNKIATGPRMLLDIASNRDWKNDPIINPEASAPEWLKQYFNYATQSLGPIAIKEMIKGPKEGSAIGRIERGMGLKPAPTYLSDPEGHAEGLRRRREGVWKRKEALEKRQRDLYGGTTE